MDFQSYESRLYRLSNPIKINSLYSCFMPSYGSDFYFDGERHNFWECVFVIDGKVITPALDEGNILPGVTRNSCIAMLKEFGYEVEERKLSLDEVIEAHKNGVLNEAFGTGTAAVISPMGLLDVGDMKIEINNNEIGPVAKKLYDTLTGIQWGKIEDKFNWTVTVTD